MSEMPEIEAVRHFLLPHLQGQRILSAELRKGGILVHPEQTAAFTNGLAGKTIERVTRRGKYLLLHLSGGSRFVIHPRMVGQIITCPHEFPESKHTHFVMRLESGEDFRYIDVRRLGKFYLLADGEKDTFTAIHSLGKEYDDADLDEAYLSASLAKSKASVKAVLLDQSVIAGIGNIYADEILFDAHIRPDRTANALGSEETAALLSSVKAVLRHYIEVNESAGYDNYLAGEGKDFANMHQLRLYDSKNCPVCNSPLQKAKVASRGTIYCENCQR